MSESLEKKKDKIIQKMKKGKYPLTIYILALIEEGENQLEFYSSAILRQSVVSDDGIFVVGIASGYDDAVYMVEDIAKEVYEKKGNLDIRSYIQEREAQAI